MNKPSHMPDDYLALAKERATASYPPYMQPEDFGYDFREWVSPFTKGAHHLGGIALVLQDWASEKGLVGSPDPEIRVHGRKPGRRTNKNLECLLERLFNLSLADVYVTNAFPFIKPGSMSGPIPKSDVIAMAARFLHRELNIVKPVAVLALGAVSNAALQHVGISCIKVPHPAARIGDINAHVRVWRKVIAEHTAFDGSKWPPAAPGRTAFTFCVIEGCAE